MALQNRVTPFGTIEADSARGDFMGNRGILHGDTKELGGGAGHTTIGSSASPRFAAVNAT